MTTPVPHALTIPPLCAVLLLCLAFALAACQPARSTPSAGEEVADAAQQSEPVAPIKLALPAIGLEVAVVPMGWQVIERDGIRTTEWEIPEDAAGWHIDSAGAGEVGTTIISGNQASGSAVFASIALGEVLVGQEMVLTGENGLDYRYRVTTVSKPLPNENPSEDEARQIAEHVAPSETARLTLITGWPAFSTTHRIFVVADALQP